MTRSFRSSGTIVKMLRLIGTQKYMPLIVAGITWDAIDWNISFMFFPTVRASKNPTNPKNVARRNGLQIN